LFNVNIVLIVRAHKIVDKETGLIHNYGFVDFAEYGVVRKVFNVTKHYIRGKRIRIDMSRRKIEFSLQTKTVRLKTSKGEM
jgi:hypothetical protein